MGMGTNIVLLLFGIALIIAISPAYNTFSTPSISYGTNATLTSLTGTTNSLQSNLANMGISITVPIFGTVSFPNPFAIFYGIVQILLTVISLPASVFNAFGTGNFLFPSGLSAQVFIIGLTSFIIIISILAWYRQSDF